MTVALAKLSFGSPLWLYGLLLLPALAALFWRAEHLSQGQLERLIRSPRLRAQLTGATGVGRRRLRFALLLAGLGGMVLAMAAPRLGEEVSESHRRGLDLIVIADVSKSMLATDIAPNRLTREKLSVQDLVGQLGGDRLGLVAFAGRAFLQAPLTVDYDAVLSAAAELDTDLIPRGGTNIGGAIDLAVEAFGKAESGNRAIVLLSDGEPTSDTDQAGGVQAAGRAAAAGVKIFTVGIGTTEGSLIPLNANGTEFVRDEDGKIVRTRLDEDNLRAVAKAGNGVYLRFTSGEATMRALVEQGLSKLKTGEIDARLARRPIERFQWPLGAGLLLLVVGGLIGERRKTRAPMASQAEDGLARLGARTITAPRAQPVAVLITLIAAIALGVVPTRAADATTPPNAAPASPTGGALELYKNHQYDNAYRAFEELAKKNPDQGSLQFNAGASAYMGGQYDEALDAFGHALTSDNADLQAKSHYNFGNTLYKRGEEQKDREAKLKDWKNALQHYDSTLEMLKRNGANDRLATDTAYNRSFVKKRLDEESKQPPQQKQPQKDGKQDQQDKQQKQDQKNQQDQQQKQDQQQGQNKQDQQGQGQDQQNQPPQDQQGQSGQSQQGKGQPSPTPSPDGKSKDDQQNANPPPKPGDSPSSSDQSPPDRTSDPNQDKPRPRGDFQSKPGEMPSPEDAQPKPADDPAEAKEEAGKMSPAQARALLDSLKGVDDRVQLNGTPDNQKKHEDSVIKDW